MMLGRFMQNEEDAADPASGTLSRDDYRERLRKFDAVVCEAIAVSQAAAQRLEMPAVGYSTYVFTRICAHARAMMCALPISRWVRKDFETWDVSSVAAHARSILEGYLLFRYLADAPSDIDTQRAFINVMHLYDCLKRIKILPHILPSEEIDGLKGQADEIISRLNEIPYFLALDAKLKKDLLAGKFIMITPQKEVIEAVGLDQAEYDFFWNYLSQYTHVLSFTFYRMEPNGRGTGLENGFDRDVLGMVLEFCTAILGAAVDKMVEMFPDTEAVRRGSDSKFSPGPSRNLPRSKKRAFNRR
jgi:hypothetical protein